jgi:hypothetical protein
VAKTEKRAKMLNDILAEMICFFWKGGAGA